MKKTTKIIIKIILTILICLCTAGVVWFLGKTSKYDNKLTEYRPQISDSPIYVELTPGETENEPLTPSLGINLGGVEILMVNLDADSKGEILVQIKENEEVICENSIPACDVSSGSWVRIDMSCELEAGKEYVISITPDLSAPYFMTVPTGGWDGLPYSVENDISIALVEAESIKVTFGDIFYYSYIILFLFAALTLLLVWTEPKRFMELVLACIKGMKSFGSFAGNDIVIILVFMTVSLSIYARAYLNGVFITADSSGYLREAVNMVAGNGMSYDGLAGYKSWFANWPLMYPFLISLVMRITNLDAYVSSKILAVILVAAILVIMRIAFKGNAWIYSLCLLNFGFMQLCYYSWSEVPFIMFMLLFGLFLGRVVSDNNPKIRDYVLVGVFAYLTFLTRYFGIFVFFVGGIYIIIFLYAGVFNKNKGKLTKAIRMIITEAISGILCVGYMLMNKVMNGMPSGVSRSDWWDDYQNLTNDLIGSLCAEFFNVFHIDVPSIFNEFSFAHKALLLVVILIGVSVFVIRNYKKETWYNVFILMATVYYGMFIVIRYFSSMDTFCYRFFAPATFILTVGIIGAVLSGHSNLKGCWWKGYAGFVISAILILSIVSLKENGYLDSEKNYYSIVKNVWDEAYADIPEKSVVIFSDMDYRSEYYRPDVIDGALYTDDSLETLRSRYYGSEYFCIQSEYASVMVDSGEYQEEMNDILTKALNENKDNRKYLAISLR